MQFGTGLSGSVVGGLYGGGGQPAVNGAAKPAYTAGPTGRTSLVAAAFGGDEDGHSAAGPVAAAVGAGAWIALIYLWWVLPR
jgi:hypothetical protein